MKKSRILPLLLAGALTVSAFAFAGCGEKEEKTPSVTSAEETTVAETTVAENQFENVKIDKTVLYDEDGYKITATRITKSRYRNGLELFITCKNNSNKKTEFNAGSCSDYDGRTALTINDMEFNETTASEGAYLELEPGKSDEMSIYISIDEAKEKGITSIEKIDLGISLITDDNGSGEYLYPLTIDLNKKTDSMSESSDESKAEAKEESKPESKANDSANASSGFKETMDKYEKFFDDYIEFMKKYKEDSGNVELISEYTKWLSDYSDMLNEMNSIDKSSLSTEDLNYYIEVHTRILEKLKNI